MKKLSIAIATSLLAIAVQAQTPQPDELLMVYEVTRHGARGGLNTDYFNEKDPRWRPGELTSMGKRQHHLIGGEMRRRYMVKNKLLDLTQYRPSEVYVRSTDINRTIEWVNSNDFLNNKLKVNTRLHSYELKGFLYEYFKL